MKMIVLPLALVWCLLQASSSLGCVAMDNHQLQQKLLDKPSEQLVFFASWCSSCKEHMREDWASKSYFLAVFDDQAAAEKAFRAFVGEKNIERCIWDKDGSIAAFYKVKSLPALRSLLSK